MHAHHIYRVKIHVYIYEEKGNIYITWVIIFILPRNIYIYILKRKHKTTCKFCSYAFLHLSCKYYGRVEIQREESWLDTDSEKRGREKIVQYRDTEGG